MDREKLDETRERARNIISSLSDGTSTCAECEHHGEPCGCNHPNGTCDAYDVCQEAADIIDTLLDYIDRLTRERDAAIRDLNGGQACFSCKHFRRNGGECFGAGMCRVDGVKIFPCDEPYMYQVEIPNNGRDVYEWRGLTPNDEEEEK